MREIISEGEFGYENINVNEQRRNPTSFLNWMSRAINIRKETPEFGWGEFETLETNNPKVFAHYRKSKKGMALAVHNFSDQEETITLKLDDPEEIRDIFGDKKYEKFDPETQKVELAANGYRWMRKRQISL